MELAAKMLIACAKQQSTNNHDTPREEEEKEISSSICIGKLSVYSAVYFDSTAWDSLIAITNTPALRVTPRHGDQARAGN
jgi:hypothetical protein